MKTLDRDAKPSAASSPFHPGELAVQARAGSPPAIHSWSSKYLYDHLPEEHQLFYSQLPFVVAAARDETGAPWATLLTGEPGFASATDPGHLRIRSQIGEGDPLEAALQLDSALGILGIELHSRRRNRTNGRIAKVSPGEVLLEVRQSYGNCPKYITPRACRPLARTVSQHSIVVGSTLTEKASSLVALADTFFIATGYLGDPAHSGSGMDASHRGGPPGFAQVKDSSTITIPDYAGNNLFNSLGNLQVAPRAGLLFIDFNDGTLLQLTGCIEIDWAPGAVAVAAGAKRLLHFSLEKFVLRRASLPLAFARIG